MKRTLLAAGLHNLIWGAAAIAFPLSMLEFLGLDPLPRYPQLWQCIGMIVGVYGVGYLIAARDPHRHWPIVLVGLLGKLFGPLGFVTSLAAGDLPLQFGLTLLTNDLVWWLPFGMILFFALRESQSAGTAYELPEDDAPLADLRSQHGLTLNQLAAERPQLVVFLRQAGCPFCRETLSDLAACREDIEATGTGIVLVHLGNEARDAAVFAEYGLADLPRIADPDCLLYRLFGLDLGSFRQLFGLRVLLRGLLISARHRLPIGRVLGKSWQMPGLYLYHARRILAGCQHEQASDRPDYLDFVRSGLPDHRIAAA